VPRRDLRRDDLHLPPALRRRPGGGPARAGPGGPPRRDPGEPGVRRTPSTRLAAGVAALHARRAAVRRLPDGWPRVGARRPPPRALDPGHLAPLTPRAARR